ncbi:hypothetical protein ACVWA2_14960, partial [Enterococcus faecalis]
PPQLLESQGWWCSFVAAANNYPTPLSSRLLPTANSQTQMTQRIQSVEVNLRTTASGGVEKGREKNKKKKNKYCVLMHIYEI